MIRTKLVLVTKDNPIHCYRFEDTMDRELSLREDPQKLLILRCHQQNDEKPLSNRIYQVIVKPDSNVHTSFSIEDRVVLLSTDSGTGKCFLRKAQNMTYATHDLVCGNPQ